jgi:hypothetical protein
MQFKNISSGFIMLMIILMILIKTEQTLQNVIAQMKAQIKTEKTVKKPTDNTTKNRAKNKKKESSETYVYDVTDTYYEDDGESTLVISLKEFLIDEDGTCLYSCYCHLLPVYIVGQYYKSKVYISEDREVSGVYTKSDLCRLIFM